MYVFNIFLKNCAFITFLHTYLMLQQIWTYELWQALDEQSKMYVGDKNMEITISIPHPQSIFLDIMPCSK